MPSSPSDPPPESEPRVESEPPVESGLPSTSAGAGAPDLSAAKKRLARDVVVFSAARIALVVALAAFVVGVGALAGVSIPVVLALLIAVIAALPLSLVVFRGLRTRVNEGIVVVDARRRAEKEDLRARLRGTADDSR